MTDTDVTFLQYYRSCPYIRHDLYLPFIPASLQTLGRVECAVASAPAPPGLRTSNPLILTLIFSVPSGRLQKIGPECFLPSSQRLFDLCPCAPILVLSSKMGGKKYSVSSTWRRAAGSVPCLHLMLDMKPGQSQCRPSFSR